MSLISLPAEILQEVCRELQRIDNGEESGVREFRSLVQCNRSLNAFVSPYLYQKLNLEPRTIFLLVRSILERPSLALRIREANFIPPDPRGNTTFDLGKAYTMLRKPGLLPAACTRHLHPDSEVDIDLLLLEFLLLRLSDVEHLLINVSVLNASSVLFAKKRWKPGTRTFPTIILPKLRKCSLYTPKYFQEDRDVIAQTQNLLLLCRPPWLWIEVPQLLKYVCPRLSLPGVEKLDIACKGMSRKALEGLLQTCPNARSIDYYGGLKEDERRAMWDEGEDEVVLAGEICNILKSHQHVLESLKLHFYEDIAESSDYNDTIPDLREFSRLRNLSLDSGILINVQAQADREGLPSDDDDDVWFLDRLPASLESLTICAACDLFFKELQTLASRKAHDFPNMKKLNLDWWHGDTIEPFAALEADLRASAIELSWYDAFVRDEPNEETSTG